MHITGRNGKTDVFSGTDILSASGVNSQYGQYSGGFDFSGSLTSIIVEVGGRDIGLSVGVMFDDVKVNVLYNVVNQIIEQTITSVEMFVALNTDAPEEVLDVVEDIFEANNTIETDQGLDFEPIEVEEISYESVEIEIAEVQIEEIEIASIDMPESSSVEINVQEVEAEIELELEAEIETDLEVETPNDNQTEQTEEIESQQESPNESDSEKPSQETNEEETEQVEEVKKESQKETQKEQTEKKEETEKPKVVAKKESSKEKAAKKVLKKIDDKQKYDSTAQLKTLVVMQVLADSKTFFESQQLINDRVGFFTNTTLPDAVISDNNIAGYLLFGGSNQLMNEMIDSQWQK